MFSSLHRVALSNGNNGMTFSFRHLAVAAVALLFFGSAGLSATPAEIAAAKRLAKEWKPADPVQRASITQSGVLYKFECYAAKLNVTRIVEVNSETQEVRFWSKMSPTLTVGPLGPYTATITSETITWNKKSDDSSTKYILDRKTKTLKTEIIYNIMDEPFRETASC